VHYVVTRGLHLAARLPRFAKLGALSLYCTETDDAFLVTGINDLAFAKGSHIVKFVLIMSKAITVFCFIP
jgi:hypothetical protein